MRRPEAILLVAAVLWVVWTLTRRPGRRRSRGHSLFYDWYLQSHLWKTRRWLWYWTSNRRCEDCRRRVVLHRRGVRYRMGTAVATYHHTPRPGEPIGFAYKRLGRESRRRGDVHQLCEDCHLAKDSWRHR